MPDQAAVPPPPAEPSRGPAPWWAINGYGCLVGLLEIVLGVSGIAAGPDDLAGWSYRVTIVVGGVGLLYGFVSQRVRSEAYAGALLVAANLGHAAVEIAATYPPFIDWTLFAINLALVASVAARVWGLTRGGMYTIPQWHRR